VTIDGQTYVMIPVILADAKELETLGDQICVTGPVVHRQVPTPSGKLTSHVVPVVWVEKQAHPAKS
jgi:hypothetical protein